MNFSAIQGLFVAARLTAQPESRLSATPRTLSANTLTNFFAVGNCLNCDFHHCRELLQRLPSVEQTPLPDLKVEKRRLVDFVASLHGRIQTRPPSQLPLRQAIRLPVKVTVPVHLAVLQPTGSARPGGAHQQAPVAPPARKSDNQRFGLILAANAWATIFAFLTTNVSVTNSYKLSAVSAVQRM